MTRLLKIFLFTFAFSLLAFIFPSPTRASYLDIQGQDPTETFKQALEAPGMNYSQFSLNSVDQIIMGLNKKLIGYPALEGETTNTSLLNSMNKAIATLYIPPTNTPRYIASVIQNTKSAQAATLDSAPYPGGFSVFSPVLVIWKTFRNISYLFFVIIFVAIGFMVMFRSKLNPQTVVNIQLALPNIIVALIGVTFSYAIASLIIDISQVVLVIIFKILLSPTMHANIRSDLSAWLDINMFTLIEKFIVDPSSFGTLIGAPGSIIVTIMDAISSTITILTLGSLNLWTLILGFTLISSIFKVFFMLLTAYVQLLFGVIFSPFIFLGAAFPSGKSPIGGWIRSQLANALVFPATFAIFALALLISNSAIIIDCTLLTGGCTGASYYPGAITPSFSWIPPILPFNPANLMAFISYGILMIAPNVSQLIQKALQTQPSLGGEMGESAYAGLKKIPVIGGLI